MKNLVVTLDIDYPKEITDLTFPLMRRYADNINADFRVITERRYPDLPIPMEKFQLYDVCEDYEWTIFVDADALINPKTIDLSHTVDDAVVIVSEYLDILNSEFPQFQTKNVMDRYDLDIHAPFYFLAFHATQKNVVKPWPDPLRYTHYVNMLPGMEANNKQREWHLDEFLLATNIVKHGISTVSLKHDFPDIAIVAHDGRYLTVDQKVVFLEENLRRLRSMENIGKNYF